jgi:two-component system CheB/CheR fusion protein
LSPKSHAMTQDYEVTTIKSPEVVSGNDLNKLVDNLLLTTYVPASVVVDQNMDIIQFRGSTTLFLKHGTGRASLNLTKLAHPSLVFELRNIVHKARKACLPVRKNSLELIRDGKASYVNIEAVPITDPANQQLFLVLFEEMSVEQFAGGHSFDEGDKRCQTLETELATIRQDMYSIIEEQEASNEALQRTNEEIVSSNEELQSTNEELNSRKEEIQYANEELQRINQELQVRNDQLTETYAYSEAICSTISEATLVLDEHLRVKSANRAFYKTFSTSAELTKGRLIYELGSRQLDVTALRNVLHNVMESGISVQGHEVQINISPVEKRTMVIHARRVVQHGKQTLLLVFEDITAHRREQELLQQRQQWFEELVDNAPAMIWVCQTDGKINFLNKAWTDYTGLLNQDGEITFLGSIHPSDVKSYQSKFAKQFIQRKAFTCEYRLKRADGEYRWVLENARPIYTAENVFIGYTGSSMDMHLQKSLTQQLNRHVDDKTAKLKQANTQLTQTAENLQAVLDSSPAAIGFFKVVGSKKDEATQDFQMAVCNRRFSSQYDSSVKELIGALASRLLGAKQFSDMKQVYQSGKSIYSEHYDVLTRLWSGRSISRHDHGIAITEIDITALKEAHVQENELIRQLNNSYQMIESLSVMKEYVQHRGAFLRTTFHDLRGSFGLVVGAASILDIIETQEERDKVLGIIQRNLTQVANMMNQLLDYSRLESGEETLEIDSFDATALLAELCEGAARTAQEKGLTLAFTGPDQLIVESDQIKVRRITQNLILNAVKYTNEGSVTIKWQLINEQGNDLPQWKLIISDTGPGLPHQLLQKLDPRHHMETALEVDAEALPSLTQGHGEGIGLFIVKRLCELIGGQMKVKSDSSSGTRFYLTFPLFYDR